MSGFASRIARSFSSSSVRSGGGGSPRSERTLLIAGSFLVQPGQRQVPQRHVVISSASMNRTDSVSIIGISSSSPSVEHPERLQQVHPHYVAQLGQGTVHQQVKRLRLVLTKRI